MMTIYQHFREHEHPFVDQVLSWRTQVEQTYTPYVTDFLDPRERQIVRSIIGETNEEVAFHFFGVREDAERKRCILAPFYETIENEDFQIALVESTYNDTFNELTHRDVLGALMSAGIDRKKFGDIYIVDNVVQIVLTKELSEYIAMQLTQIKRAPVRFNEQTFEHVLENVDEWHESFQTVSSLRLDVLIKEIYNLSRKQAVQYIQANKVKVNFTEITDPALQVFEGDLFSVKGHGRSKLLKVHSTTRKNKLKVTTARLLS